MDIKAILREYGLTEKEAQIYLILLPLGSINLQEIAKRLDLPRTTVYNTLNYLSSKGLVNKITKGGITFFEASDPKKFVDSLNQKKELVLSVLPELEELKNNLRDLSSVEIYEGFKGVSTILLDVFKQKQEVFYFGSYSKSAEILSHLPEHFASLRLSKKIHAKIIMDPYEEERFHLDSYKKITEMRFLDSMKDFPCMIFIYGKNVAMYTLEGDLVGIIIKNESFSRALKIVFDLYWKVAKPVRL